MNAFGIGGIVLASLLAGMRDADARDSTKLVCAALVRPADGGGQLGLFVHFIESRADDGASRTEWVSTIYQGRHFGARSLNKTGAPAQGVAVSMTAGKQTVYRGTYSLAYVPSSGWTLHLTGTFNEDPSAKGPGKKSAERAIDVDLPCTDISN